MQRECIQYILPVLGVALSDVEGWDERGWQGKHRDERIFVYPVKTENSDKEQFINNEHESRV